MAEMEGKGLDYERFALNKLFKRIVREQGVRSVLEIPARGEKAMPSIYSIALAEAGCDVTLINPEERSRWAWDELGYDVTFLQRDEITETGLADASFDFLEIFWRERPLKGEVVKETIFKRRTDGDLCRGKYFFHRLRHNVRAAMAVDLSSFYRIKPDWFYDRIFSQRT